MRNIILKNSTKGEYTLLARVKDNDEVFEYVVAWDFQADGTWSQGHYFDDLLSAIDFIHDTRKDLLKQMHEYVRLHIDDEEAYMDWIVLVPDEPDEEDFENIAEDEELWKCCCILFGKIIRRYE